MGDKKKDDSKVTHSDIHEKLWAARDFEINHLWQRSIFLATFITLTFTLYFTAVDKFTDDYPSYRVEQNKESCYINIIPIDDATYSNIEPFAETDKSISESEAVNSKSAREIDNPTVDDNAVETVATGLDDSQGTVGSEPKSEDTVSSQDSKTSAGNPSEESNDNDEESKASSEDSKQSGFVKNIKEAFAKHIVSYDSEDLLHILILHGICILGFCFSVLWICMARGSKYMYERLEHGIDKAYTADSGFLDTDLGDAIRNEFYENLLAMGDYTYLPRHGSLPLSDYNYHAFSLDGAKFSSSKINIMLGYLLAVVWIVLTFFNPSIILGDSIGYDIPTYMALFLIVALIGFSLSLSFRSRFIIFRVIRIILITICVFGILVMPIIIYSKHSLLGIETSIVLFVNLIFAFLIGYAVLSDNNLHFSDYPKLVLGSCARIFDPRENQIKWVYNFLNKKDFPQEKKEGLESIRDNIVSIFKTCQESCDDPLQSRILKGCCQRYVFKYSVKWLLSNEYLRNIFETAIMYRESFNDLFLGDWIDDKGNLRVHINQSHVELFLKDEKHEYHYVFDIFPAGHFDTSRTHVEARLFADTDWTSIRAGKKYELIKDDKCIHLIQERINGRRVYMTIDGKDSLLDRSLKEEEKNSNGNSNNSEGENNIVTKVRMCIKKIISIFKRLKRDKASNDSSSNTPSALKVTITVIDSAGENGEKKQHTYEYTLTKKEGDAPDNNKKQDTVVDGKKKFHVSGTVSFDLNADVE